MLKMQVKELSVRKETFESIIFFLLVVAINFWNLGWIYNIVNLKNMLL